jgi:hypothetical protein
VSSHRDRLVRGYYKTSSSCHKLTPGSSSSTLPLLDLFGLFYRCRLNRPSGCPPLHPALISDTEWQQWQVEIRCRSQFPTNIECTAECTRSISVHVDYASCLTVLVKLISLSLFALCSVVSRSSSRRVESKLKRPRDVCCKDPCLIWAYQKPDVKTCFVNIIMLDSFRDFYIVVLV